MTEATATPILQVRDLFFSYDRKVPVLQGIDLTITEPGLYCILGPNGAGKSTLARCINNLIKPTSGEVLVDGKPVGDYSLKELSEIITYVPAMPPNTFDISVVDSILLGRPSRNQFRTSDSDLDKAQRLMQMFELQSLAFRSISRLSAGQGQSVALARGIMQETRIIVLDEPTANLDVRHQVFVTELFAALADAKDITVIMISHDLNIAARYAQKLFILSDEGRIHASGTANEVMTEDIIRYVYGVESSVFDNDGHPLISLEAALSEQEHADYRRSTDA